MSARVVDIKEKKERLINLEFGSYSCLFFLSCFLVANPLRSFISIFQSNQMTAATGFIYMFLYLCVTFLWCVQFLDAICIILIFLFHFSSFFEFEFLDCVQGGRDTNQYDTT